MLPLPRRFRPWAFASFVFAASGACVIAAEKLKSPSGALRVEFDVAAGGPSLRAWLGEAALVESAALGLDLGASPADYAAPAFSREQRRDSWKPLYGEHASLPDHYNALRVRFAHRTGVSPSLELEIRAYDSALALRYLLSGKTGQEIEIRQDRTAFRFPISVEGWPLPQPESLYGADPIRLADYKRGLQAPLTLRNADFCASLLEADTRDFPRLQLARGKEGEIATRFSGSYRGALPLTTPWRVLLVGRDAAALLGSQDIVTTLNPPARGDFSWVRPGKVLSAVGNFPNSSGPRRMETAHLKRLIDWAAEQRFRYLQLDWGWNGTEGPWTDEQRAAYREIVPERFRSTDWEANTTGALDRVAKGYVPFRPNPKTKGTDLVVDLDLPALIAHGRARGVGVSLYVNSRWSLPKQDMDTLFTLYEKWGLAGLKPGFVLYGKQEDSAFILRLIETAAKHKLWLNIHDEHLPEGSARTYPHVLSTEAGAGAENKPTLAHDLTLPFARGLAGPFDYTPLLFTPGRSNLYQLAYLLVAYNPAPVIRGGYSAWNPPGGRGGVELELLREMPDTWDDSRVLSADIGRHLAVARRSGDRWFLGAVTADRPADLALKLDFLPAGAYRFVRFADVETDAPDRPSVREVSTVKAGDSLPVNLRPGGGLAGWFEPAR